ncbi:NADH-quinone oxidoreductase subunit NuoG [Brackiella oedipodis]|uniref:NADH-quinone oxidoreductase subunit NuoG n=1 Tax=Brackiella oedipodis TaxID=124225 RepID=UPI00048CE5AD|nr:NADH-quinone oxidoreductase subunit NuoG [Brackiella oedipodis]
MVELTIDGKQVSVPEGSMVMHAAQELGLYVPHFCYHKKLSIAANCRMCLVEVEKNRKAVPACATPVAEGMVVHTTSPMAVAAQKAVMEFLLINHPLDCPICDQGGECQLQDLAVGYGHSESHYHEEKRVVFHKSMGPLVSAEEMARCIHCTRCVRFGKEIGGIQEIGMINRGEHSEITTFVGKAVKSELSGNMIDVCPVGALTSKPFRYAARTWELARRRTISPHDSVGTNVIAQLKNNKILRVVPFENEDVNECWISDRDRWSYEGLYADRVTQPMIKNDDGVWREASWEEALTEAAKGLQKVHDSEGAGQIGALSAEYATLEEMRLLGRLVRGLGSEHIDSRLRLSDTAFDEALAGVPWLGMPIVDLNNQDTILVVGSQDLRREHPLFAQRLRQAAKAGTRVILLDSTGADALIPQAQRLTVAPSQFAATLAQLNEALQQETQDDNLAKVVSSLKAEGKIAILMGNAVVNHVQASNIIAHAQQLAKSLNATYGYLTSGANTVGAYVAGAVPQNGGMNYAKMLNNPLKGFVVLHAETLDMANTPAALEMLNQAYSVAITPYKTDAFHWADVILPVGPSTETSGTFINAEGRAQSFKGVAANVGDSRPAWKVLRVLGNLLKLADFDDESSESIRDEVLAQGFTSRLNNEVRVSPSTTSPQTDKLERVSDVPIYRNDPIVRRAEALQQASVPAFVAINQATIEKLSLTAGSAVRIKTPSATVELPLIEDNHLADNVVRIPNGFPETAVLGCINSQLTVESV